MSSYEDDLECIKRRLIIDGDGEGHDQQIDNLVKMIIRWTNLPEDALEESDLMYNRIHDTLLEIEYNQKKTSMEIENLLKQTEFWRTERKEVEKGIEEILPLLERRRKDLYRLQEIEREMQELSFLSDKIKTLPSVEESKAKIDKLKSQTTSLKKTYDNLTMHERILSLDVETITGDCTPRNYLGDVQDVKFNNRSNKDGPRHI